jgi:Bacterial regulatory proteins, luxR family
MSPVVNHLASLVSTWSPPGLPLSGRAWKHSANGWRTVPVRGSAMTWPRPESTTRWLMLSEHTVHRHLANILRKLDLSSRAAAAAWGVRTGLI